MLFTASVKVQTCLFPSLSSDDCRQKELPFRINFANSDNGRFRCRFVVLLSLTFCSSHAIFCIRTRSINFYSNAVSLSERDLIILSSSAFSFSMRITDTMRFSSSVFRFSWFSCLFRTSITSESSMPNSSPSL